MKGIVRGNLPFSIFVNSSDAAFAVGLLAWKELSVESQSTYALPEGREQRMKLDKAVFIRSGRSERTTSIFWNGTRSRPALADCCE